MYAIFEAKGKQFRAEPDATLRLPSLDAEPGERVTFDHVLLAERDEGVLVGQPALADAVVAAEVVRHGRGDKIVVYKMKRRKGYRRKQGHRQGFTEVRIVDIDLGGVKRTAKPARAAKKESPAAKPEKAPAKAAPIETEAQPAVEIPITDSARELAEQAGLDLANIEGSGKDGRILKSDVQKAIKARDEA